MEEKEEAVIQVDELTVRYRIPDEKISGVKEYLDKVITRKLKHRDFVALKNLNLAIKKGERVGIIGHNGAGKSTLLKVIAHVIKPSEGTINVKGSIAPLLELGAGFDSELTGIQNIYLNGSILGRSKKYLDAAKDDIINFADLGDFIHYPVKNYSSGMRAKLGFAIATQVDSDILLVDEVFGVGDENFKRKSKAKMVEMINSGKTVIIVSHDMTQIVDLTDRVIWMNNGEVFEEGEPQQVCKNYCDYMLEHEKVAIERREARPLINNNSNKQKKINIIKDEAKGKIGRLVQKSGLLNRILNDSALLEELMTDRRILRRIQEDDRIIENIINSKKALDFIEGSEEVIYNILETEKVKNYISDNPYLLMKQEKKPNKIWGKADECIYYKNNKILYVKGWYMPVEDYSDVRISIDGAVYGDAQRHLHRTGANNGSENPLDKYSGWEFIKEMDLISDIIEISVINKNEVIFHANIEVKKSDNDLPECIKWKSFNQFSEKRCWKLYQKMVMSGFNLLSFQKKNLYHSLLEEYDDIGCLYKKNLFLSEKELGFEFNINHLGLRGPSDAQARNIVIGGGCGLGFGVNEDKAWYADKAFQKNWLNLCFVCETRQMKRLLGSYLKGAVRSRTAVLLYEAAFWNIGISHEVKRIPPIDDMNEMFAKEKESFYDFYNKLYEGIYRIIDSNEGSLINCKYAQFQFEKNEKQCELIVREWKSILTQFSKIIVLRVPNKEYISAGNTDIALLQSLKQQQDLGWEILNNELKSLRNIEFIKMNDFLITDFFNGTGFMNENGNEKLRNWIKKLRSQ